MKPDPHPSIPDHACPNCEAITSGNFCHYCGQETHLHPASLREFVHEFIGHYVALEGRLWGTLGRLMFRPGALTNEYIQGRRVRFVQPLRLYLTLSLIFFAVLKLNAGDGKEVLQTDAKPALVQSAEAGKDQPSDVGLTIGDRSLSQWTEGMPSLHHKLENFEHMSDEEKSKAVTAGFYHYAPYAIFCMMPVFALFLKVLYLGSGRRFGEHLLFALHTNAFAFALLTLTFLPIATFFKFAMWLWLLGYLPWAMRRVYHKSRFGTAWRWLTLMAGYMITLGISIVLTLGAGVVTAGH
ncbi:MAG: DUF3667 domain-containing protein [Sphingomonadaceae bacterium]